MSPTDNNILKTYMKYVLNAEISPIISQITSEIPRTMYNAIKLGEKKSKNQPNTPHSHQLKEQIGKILRDTTKKFGFLTPKARKNLENYYATNNIIEVAHQPKFLGGERFLLNKIALGGEIANKFEKSIPIFFIGNYDKIHNELTKTHFPTINAPSGFPIGIENQIVSSFEGQCVECLPLPTERNFIEMMSQIQNNYYFSINSCNSSQEKKNLLKDRVEHGLLFLKRTFLKSDSYTSWFLNIIGEIANINADYGYLFIIASDPNVREIFLPAYEKLLKNRNKYINLYNNQIQLIQAQGFIPPLRGLSSDFVPFFYECMCNECNQRRVQLFVKENANISSIFGTCEQCKTKIEIEINPQNPNLDDFKLNLTPRVDSRQYLISNSLKPVIHISGTGETKYYMQILPVLQKFDPSILLPVIYFYNKLTLNTFMTRELEQKLISEKFPEYLNHLKNIMKPIGKINKLTKKIAQPESEQFMNYTKKGSQLLINQANAMNDMSKYLNVKLNSISDSKDENLVRSYLSLINGNISQERSGQEAVYHWLDAGIHNGLYDMFPEYRRIYKLWMPPGLPVLL